ncbi:hypothetical protein BTA35_0204440 [Oceanospirillum linum]|uniref:SsuA/THI5-like domain-containing protein n=1 Tax=Oceanospirillum linum TaxID=966 RepID=A0A1T1HFW1_OCELI|nr:hypothetical protein BTA35_0204440 [Oceanospirillum linum]SEG01361.1 NitT/TauT family transport system substrate-binding protein [Oleiphilus messinensis]SMP21805.1 NitT/TauT family transport system substrate-binding protein [Oceanospirillum linum]
MKVSLPFFSVRPLVGFGRQVVMAILPAFLFLTLLFLQGCEQTHPPLKVGTNIWPGYESLYIARDKQFINPEQVSLTESVNATQVLRAFKAGQLDVAALTMDEALTLQASVRDLRVIAVMDFSHGADVLIAKPGIKTLQELSGRTLIVEKSAVGAIIMQSALDKAGLEKYEISVRNAPVNEHLKLWQDEAVAGVVTFEPFKSLLTLEGGHVLFDSSEIPGRVMDVLVVHEETARNRPDQLRHLLAGHFRALTFMAENRAESASIMSERLKIPPYQVLSSFESIRIPDLEENRNLLGESGGFKQQIFQLKQMMLNTGLLSQKISIGDDFLTDSFLPRADE